MRCFRPRFGHTSFDQADARHELARLTALESAKCLEGVTLASEWQALRDELDRGKSSDDKGVNQAGNAGCPAPVFHGGQGGSECEASSNDQMSLQSNDDGKALLSQKEEESQSGGKSCGGN